MSLKTRLSLLIVVLVTLIVIALSALYLHSVASSRFGDLQERATTAALQVQSLLIQRISERTASQPPPADFEGTKSLWSRIVREDAELAGLLKDTMASSRTILEIGIAGADGDVLASSNPSSVGKALRALPSLAQWARLSPWEQLAGVFGRPPLSYLFGGGKNRLPSTRPKGKNGSASFLVRNLAGYSREGGIEELAPRSDFMRRLAAGEEEERNEIDDTDGGDNEPGLTAGTAGSFRRFRQRWGHPLPALRIP